MTLSNRKISLTDSKNLVICEVTFENDSDGPIRLILNDATVQIFNTQNIKIWERNLSANKIS